VESAGKVVSVIFWFYEFVSHCWHREWHSVSITRVFQEQSPLHISCATSKPTVHHHCVFQ